MLSQKHGQIIVKRIENVGFHDAFAMKQCVFSLCIADIYGESVHYDEIQGAKIVNYQTDLTDIILLRGLRR